MAATVQPATAQSPRAVVELFTSQGCSSCPPADKILGELAQDPSVVALTMPIDYWDYLGWKDTLADSRFSTRQSPIDDAHFRPPDPTTSATRGRPVPLTTPR